MDLIMSKETEKAKLLASKGAEIVYVESLITLKRMILSKLLNVLVSAVSFDFNVPDATNLYDIQPPMLAAAIRIWWWN
jgi:hypothetical protein